MATVKAVAVIAGDKNVKGSLNFLQDSTGYTHVKGTISGLKPGLHGFHIHALGDTTNGCISTGPHFNPLKKDHGAPTDSERHAGDLGNITAGSDGVAEISIRDSQIPLSGKHSILGRAVVVHADPDDLGRGGHELSKTTGNAGGRVGCDTQYVLTETNAEDCSTYIITVLKLVTNQCENLKPQTTSDDYALRMK
ncbi:hypothetical protein V2J09_008644 [Rumex salicifolius]